MMMMKTIRTFKEYDNNNDDDNDNDDGLFVCSFVSHATVTILMLPQATYLSSLPKFSAYGGP